jgi:hypothetical protein
LFTFILLFFANFVGVVGFCRCWFNILFGMSVKLSKLNIIDLNVKELYLIFSCVFFLLVFCYIPSFLFFL